MNRFILTMLAGLLLWAGPALAQGPDMEGLWGKYAGGSGPGGPGGQPELVHQIPGYYALYRIRGHDPSQPVDRQAIAVFLKRQADQAEATDGWHQIQVAVYDQGQENIPRVLADIVRRHGGITYFDRSQDEHQPLMGLRISTETMHKVFFTAKKSPDPLTVFKNEPIWTSGVIKRLLPLSGSVEVGLLVRGQDQAEIVLYIPRDDPKLGQLKEGDVVGVIGRVIKAADNKVYLDAAIDRTGARARHNLPGSLSPEQTGPRPDRIEPVSPELVYEIPGFYAQYRIVGQDRYSPVNVYGIVEFLEKKMAETDLDMVQVVVYDQGRKPGQGARLLACIGKNLDQIYVDDEERFGRDTVEKMACYWASPKILHDLYTRNGKEEADKLFKDQPVMCFGNSVKMEDNLNQGRKVTVNLGSGSVVLNISADDYLLPYFKEGDSIAFQGMVRNYAAGVLMLDAEIVGRGESHWGH